MPYDTADRKSNLTEIGKDLNVKWELLCMSTEVMIIANEKFDNF